MGEIKISANQQKRAFSEISRIAKEFENLLTLKGNWQDAVDEIRDIIDRNLSNNEYLLILDLQTLALVHSNRLREGIYFNDEVGKNGAKADKPIVQIYHRNTGETLIDIACPVFINGEHKYYIRMGIPFQASKLSNQLFLGVVPLIILGVALLIYSSFSPIAIGLTVVTIVFSGVYADFFRKKLLSGLSEAFKVTKSASKGDLRVLAQARSKDELGALAFEVNKLSMGIKTIIADLAEVAKTSKDISHVQAEQTNSLAERFQSLVALLEEFSAGATAQIDYMKKAETQVDEMQKISHSIRTSTQEILEMANSALNTSTEGHQAVDEAIKEMGVILDVTQQANASIRRLADQAGQIEDIVSVINEIASQTNLLALNAAIEAARAGEYGKGFAVVAEEVRKLADHSTQSSNEIMNLITGVQETVKNAVISMDQGMKELNKGKLVIEKAGKAITSLDQAVSYTKSGIEENLQNTNYLLNQSETLVEAQKNATSVATQFAASAQEAASTVDEQVSSTEEVAALASELAETATHLNKVIQRFTI